MYVSLTDLEAKLPAVHLVDAFDDNNDGIADRGVVDKACEQASEEVDAYLVGRYTCPIDEPNALVRRAALLFALSIVYERRGAEIPGPLASDLKAVQATLGKIQDNELSLDAAAESASGSGAVVTSPMATEGSTL